MAMEAAAQSTLHIAIIPTPGLGHLIPLTELIKQLSRRHNFSFTFLVPTDGSSTESQTSLLQSLPASIAHAFLPPVDLSDIPAGSHLLIRVILTLTRSIPALRDSLTTLTGSTRLVALIFDVLGSPALDLAGEFRVPAYIFYTCSAMNLCSAFCLPKLDLMYSCEYRDLPEPVHFFPGCVPVQGVDMVDPVQDKKNEAYKRILDVAKQYHKAAGILVNSFLNLEPAPFEALMQNGDGIPPIYPVGPLVRTGLEHGLAGLGCCLRWLDKQPSGSVLFVSFGSGGTLSSDQLTELAFGLEISGQRFLWVVRNPNDMSLSAAYFDPQLCSDPLQFLPNGFLDRTGELGLVVPSWAPQVQILSHSSTGGFLTHCGWNSILESIVHGVPLIAWPLYAEQRMNSVEVTEDWKVALRVKPNEKGIVEREQIAGYVSRLIEGWEGKAMRERMKVLQGAAEAALGNDGSSSKSRNEIAHILMTEGKSHESLNKI
ncbi:hypothetical protein Nepgr_011183 [Nepenthes gracilis]|uniref:Glycosyltransferase n=1 Tax=Nepenthes gracilis TaxID=150966 RepID=A0AAD3XLR2_NEPGR|nr:hypothetical protein Nepgr_011183 [Nepenthes gracilis]